jgi:beta-galactosidase
VLDRYRLRWNDVRYEPGELRVVVYDDKGNQVGEETVRTADALHHIELSADRTDLSADGSDMSFLTIRIVDKDGNLCPDADNQVTVKVTGAGSFKGICNGDATSTEVFTRPTMKAFHGMLSVGIITTEKPGDIRVQLSARGLRPATLTLHSH